MIVAVSGFFLGSLVDRYPKKTAMLLSSVCSLVAYALALVICVATPSDEDWLRDYGPRYDDQE